MSRYYKANYYVAKRLNLVKLQANAIADAITYVQGQTLDDTLNTKTYLDAHFNLANHNFCKIVGVN